jgi:hypothetical protein
MLESNPQWERTNNMGLESASYLDGLVTTNPVAGDGVAQGDDHIRLIKAVLKASFPGITAAHTFSAFGKSMIEAADAAAARVVLPPFPSGTVMLFAQTAAPTGWTKSTTHNDKALRVVSGTASSGGSVAFTTAFASQAVAGTTDGTAITAAQMPSHTHYMFAAEAGDNDGTYHPTNTQQIRVGYDAGSDDDHKYKMQGTSTSATIGRTSSSGSGETHTHAFTGTAIDLAVSYVDCILAVAD